MTLKHIMENPVLIVAFYAGKTIFPESRETLMTNKTATFARFVFIKLISHYKKIGYNIDVLKQTACLVVNPITVGNIAFLFNCTPLGRTSDSMMVQTYLLMRW